MTPLPTRRATTLVVLALSLGLSFFYSQFALAQDIEIAFVHPAFSGIVDGDTTVFNCGNVPQLSTAHIRISGACDESPELSFSESIQAVDANTPQRIASLMSCRFGAIDSCGATVSLTIHVLVVDTLAPILEGVPADLRLPPNLPLPTKAYVYATDNCSRDVPVQYSADTVFEVNEMRVTRTWSATDDAGNSSTGRQVIIQGIELVVDCPNDRRGAELTATTAECSTPATVCLPLPNSFSGSVTINGKPARLVGCTAETLTSYNLETLFPVGSTAPFEAIWRIGQKAERTRIESEQELLDWLNNVDQNATWQIHERAGKRLLVGPDVDVYGDLTIVEAATKLSRTESATQTSIAEGFAITAPVGEHSITITEGSCVDTLWLLVNCDAMRIQNVTTVVGTRGLHCIELAQLQADYTFAATNSSDTQVLSIETLTADGCLRFNAHRTGDAEVVVEACHRSTGECINTSVQFSVIGKLGASQPQAIDDLFGVAWNGQRVLNILANDVVDATIAEVSFTSGTLGKVRLDVQNRLHYTAPLKWCGEERIGYQLCTPVGCDTASVLVQVTCEDILVFNGFSPNGDGLNEEFSVLGLENYPDNRLVVFNQLGNEVYATANYQSDWRGDASGQPLPDGTYYYVLEITGRGTESGYLQLQR